MKDLQSMALLLDFYGSLLTARQQEWMQAYFLEDLSLAEIAQAEGVSRQAVHDLLKRSEAALLEYEERLGFVREHKERQALLTALQTALRDRDTERALTIVVQLKEQ